MDALGHILSGQLPYAAIVVDRFEDIVAANAARAVLFEGCAGLAAGSAGHRVPLRRCNRRARLRGGSGSAEWIPARAARAGGRAGPLAREARGQLAALHEELTGYVPPYRPGAGSGLRRPATSGHSAGGPLGLITTITNFATTADIKVSEMRGIAWSRRRHGRRGHRQPGQGQVRDRRGRRAGRVRPVPPARRRDLVHPHPDRRPVPRPRSGQPSRAGEPGRGPRAAPGGAALLPVHAELDHRPPRVRRPGPGRPPRAVRPLQANRSPRRR